jgi:hypothetical protein
MTLQPIPIDGLAILSEHLRSLRLRQYRFAKFEVYIFTPEPGTSGASEAFISARYKQRVFSLAGFRCTICRLGEESAVRGLISIGNGSALYIVQRPLDIQCVLQNDPLRVLNLDEKTTESVNMSALTDTVSRIIAPFIEQRRSKLPLEPIRVGIFGNKGFFGREIQDWLMREGVETFGVDLDDDASMIVGTHIVISAVGKPGLISKQQLGVCKDLLVDVGYSYDEEQGRGRGDFSSSCYSVCKFYTPVPGGVGPLQALTLVERAARLSGCRSYKPWNLSISKPNWSQAE